MHEVSLCESILKIIEKQAEKDKFSRVVKVQLAVGKLSGASPEALLFAFPLVAKETIADGAELSIVEVEGRELRVGSLDVA